MAVQVQTQESCYCYQIWDTTCYSYNPNSQVWTPILKPIERGKLIMKNNKLEIYSKWPQWKEEQIDVMTTTPKSNFRIQTRGHIINKGCA